MKYSWQSEGIGNLDDQTISDERQQRVLLLNAGKANDWGASRIHAGLLSIGTILSARGHIVKVVDYSYLQFIRDRFPTPSVQEILTSFRPDVVGLSTYTFLYWEAHQVLDKVREMTKARILLGGPHATLFPDDFREEAGVYAIVRGEAEEVILDLVEEEEGEGPFPRLLTPSPPSAASIPMVDVRLALGWEHLQEYQLQLSRGCPYQCSFCAVKTLASNKIRARDIEFCIKEVEQALDLLPALSKFSITDDCPTFDLARLKLFLKTFAQLTFNGELWIDNIRANLLDNEFLSLYKASGGKNVCVGVESGSPEVFNRVNKGETLEDVQAAAKKIREHGLLLGLCFVIGLPGDNEKCHRQSMEFAFSLRPDYIFWNMCMPFPQTEVYDWYIKHGRIGDVRGCSTLISPRGDFVIPPSDSLDFPEKTRIKAWLTANFETHHYFRCPKDVFKLFFLARRYGCLDSYCRYLHRYGMRTCIGGFSRLLGRFRDHLKVVAAFSISLFFSVGKTWKYALLLFRSHRAWHRARKSQLPGLQFNNFGRAVGRRLLTKGNRMGLGYVLTPVNATRYFEFSFVRDFFETDKTMILDVSSPRLFTLYMAKAFPDASFQIINPDTIDLAETDLLAKRLKIPNLEILSGSCEWLRRWPANFDIVWSISVIEHIEGLYCDIDAVSWMFEALRPGGLLFLTVPVDREFGIEYRSEDFYGTQAPLADGRYFFQRHYDEQAINERLIKTLGVAPDVVRWYGERKPGWFRDYTERWKRYGLQCTVDDPALMAEHFTAYESWEQMPGAGVCCLRFRKPSTQAPQKLNVAF